jgi:hypothetical protein
MISLNRDQLRLLSFDELWEIMRPEFETFRGRPEFTQVMRGANNDSAVGSCWESFIERNR